MHRIILSLAFIATAFSATTALAADPDSAVATIRNFYQQYLAHDHTKNPKRPRPSMTLSPSFLADIRKTDAACKKYGDGPCGWGADGDEYLDTQETDPALSFANSGITFKLLSPGTVQVQLNVYPSIQDAGNFYLKTITYKMVRQGGSFVADDIAYTDGVSTRKKLADERKFLLAHPRPAGSGK